MHDVCMAPSQSCQCYAVYGASQSSTVAIQVIHSGGTSDPRNLTWICSA